jgi:prepilin-type N-terminal cleavage/methylation domain-containing protein
MERRIQSGDSAPPALWAREQRRSGYTLIELMIVMAIISVLVSIAVPLYQKALLRTKESLLKNNLFTMRTVIDEYTFDKKKAPQTLQDLVSEGYLRAIPIDHGGCADLGGPDRARNLGRAQRIGSEEPGRHTLFGVVTSVYRMID